MPVCNIHLLLFITIYLFIITVICESLRIIRLVVFCVCACAQRRHPQSSASQDSVA